MSENSQNPGDAPDDRAAQAGVAEEPAAPPPLGDRVAEVLQRAIGAIVGSNRRPPRRLKSLLNGTWLGHPLHPAVTDVPVGAWLLTAVFDVVWLAAPTANAWAARGAEVTVLAGIAGALGAVITGMTDWSDTYGRERSTGLLHGLFNVGATVLFAVSAGLRLTQGAGESTPAAILGFIGLACVLYAAYLGGDMVYTLGTGVNHTAWEAAGEGFEAVMPLAGLEENRLYRATVAGVPVVLARTGERVCAVSATCPHAGGPLDEGSFEGGVVQCPWHGSRFRLCDGHALTGPATVDAARYEVRVSGGQVELKRAGGH